MENSNLNPDHALIWMGVDAHKHMYRQDGIVETTVGTHVLVGYKFVCEVCDVEFYVNREVMRNVLIHGCVDGYYIGGPYPLIEDIRDGLVIHRPGPPWKNAEK